MRTKFLVSVLLLLLSTGCWRVSASDARILVLRYNEAICEAYRTGDILKIDGVVGPDAPDGRRLTGLIGARVDMGIFLDAHMVSMEVLGQEQTGDHLLVRTRERWRYRDIHKATGAQVGDASEDYYEMSYDFMNHKGTWLVEETKFATPPQVGRKGVPWSMDVRDAHGLMTPPATSGRQP